MNAYEVWLETREKAALVADRYVALGMIPEQCWAIAFDQTRFAPLPVIDSTLSLLSGIHETL